jgi:hypothetical protein
MKKRLLCRLLDEAPFPAVVLAFALGQSLPAAHSKHVSVSKVQSPLVIQVDESIEKGLNRSVTRDE